ncbi:retron St85 family RNA-directed DNA polymerase [Rhodoferax sp. WC2427]|uniref:retron St85 family RNA-directed DNA polymerase n=1 Tax=Rhodoferax sp. WC2427 TaxID=3234144 RepID=UPI0034675FC0
MTARLAQIMFDTFGLSEENFDRLVTRSPHSYKIYTIPKKSGGVRTIAQPAKEIKFLQRWLIENVFSKLPIHDCASAYKTGASIKSNANAHKENEYISKFDFENFFPSIKHSDLTKHFKNHLEKNIHPDDIKTVTRLCCIRPKGGGVLCLSIGAPSSPILSNSIMHEFDTQVNNWCKTKKITYTRYADDMTFSTNTKNASAEIELKIQQFTENISYPSLKLNSNKTIHLSKKFQRRITGVIINNDGQLSIGRDRKRLISSLIHKFTLGKLQNQDIFQLQGLIGFSKDIEPDFIKSMKKKYGSQVVDGILSIRIID